MTTTRQRRIDDYRAIQRLLASPHVAGVRTWASEADRQRGVANHDPAAAAIYEIDLRVPSYADSDGGIEQHWTLYFDATRSNYPRRAPAVTVQPRPWHPHVSPSGSVCKGAVWSKGMSLAAMVIAIARMLAWEAHVDFAGEHGGHYSGDAIRHFQKHRRGRALAHLTFPSLRPEEEHPGNLRGAMFGTPRPGGRR